MTRKNNPATESNLITRLSFAPSLKINHVAISKDRTNNCSGRDINKVKGTTPKNKNGTNPKYAFIQLEFALLLIKKASMTKNDAPNATPSNFKPNTSNQP